jgi:hypothetical protein
MADFWDSVGQLDAHDLISVAIEIRDFEADLAPRPTAGVVLLGQNIPVVASRALSLCGRGRLRIVNKHGGVRGSRRIRRIVNFAGTPPILLR